MTSPIQFRLPKHAVQLVCLEPLDRLAWQGGFCVRAYGARVGVRVNDARYLERLVERLPFGWTPARSAVADHVYSLVFRNTDRPSRFRAAHELYSGSQRRAKVDDAEALLDAFEADVQLFVAEVAKARVFVHAGVVGWRGKAIVIPGRSFAGKTTLVTELLRAGATYYSDEYAVIDPSGRVHPFARPLGVREPERTKSVKRDAAELGATSGTRPLPVGCIVVTEYREGASWRPRPLSPGRAALALLENTVPARSRAREALEVLHRAAVNARAIKTSRGEAAEAALRILRLAES